MLCCEPASAIFQSGLTRNQSIQMCHLVHQDQSEKDLGSDEDTSEYIVDLQGETKKETSRILKTKRVTMPTWCPLNLWTGSNKQTNPMVASPYQKHYSRCI